MKKIVLKIVIILMAIGIFSYPSINMAKSVPLGDMNADGRITEEDLSILKCYLIDQEELNDDQMVTADINQDHTISITDYSLLKAIALGFIEQPFLQDTIYDVELDKFDIKNDGTTWQNNAKGMTNAIQYAEQNGYQEVRFPLGTYTIEAPTPIILEAKNLVINFNDSTIKMQEDPYDSHWHMIELREPAENLVIKNGTIQGNRFSQKFDSTNPYNEGTIPFSIKGGNHITIENLMIKDSTGYGMTVETGMNRSKRVEIWANEFESGSISDTGENQENINTMRSKKMYPVGDLGGEFEIGYTAGYQGYYSILHQEYEAYFYDKEQKFISKETEKQYVKSSLPPNCEYIRLVIPQTEIKNGSEGCAFITNAKTFRNSTIKNCTFDANSAVGFAIGGGQNFTIEDCNFTRNGINIEGRPALSAKVAVDLEDGWECMQNITLRRNNFENNRYDLTSCAGDNLTLEENNFTNGCNIYARSTNYTITKNHFQGPVEFGVSMNGKVNNNTYTDCSIHTYYQRFGSDTQTYWLNMTNETFKNSSVYAQNLDSKKQNQLVKNSTFTTTDGKKVWIKGDYENCTFTQANIYNSAKLINCKIQNTNMYAQASSYYETCNFENGNMINNSGEEITIQDSQLTNVEIELTSWANACKLKITNSTLMNTDPSKNMIRLSAGKAKEVSLTKNTISSANDVIRIFDTTYSPPQGKIALVENNITIPENSYVINGNKITSGKYEIEGRKNTLNKGDLLHPIYQNSDYLTIMVEENKQEGEKTKTDLVETMSINTTIYQPVEEKTNLASIAQEEKNSQPSLDMTLKTTNQALKPGEEFDIYVKLKNNQDIENGLLALSAQLDYNQDRLEVIKIEGQNNWIFDENSFNEKNLKFLIDTNQYVREEGTLLKIRFKVKSTNLTLKEITIGIKNVVTSNGVTDITLKDTILTIPMIENNQEDKISGNMNLQTVKKEYQKGEEIEITASLSDIETNKGISSLKGRLQYDRASLDLIEIQGLNHWLTSYDQKKGEFLLERNDVITNNTDLLKIRFRVKQDTTQELTIALKNVTITDGNQEATLPDKAINITIRSEDSNNSNDSNDIAKSPEQIDPNNNSVNTILSEKTNTIDSIANRPIPYAGKKHIIFKMFFIITILSMLFLFIKKIIENKKKQ